MNFEEFAEWLRVELEANRMAEHQVADLLAQRLLFDRERAMIEAEFRFKVVGYVANERGVSDSMSDLLRDAAESFPDRMLYFEPIGFQAFA
jgi:hypothetical protein